MSQETTQDLTQSQVGVEDDTECIATLEYQGKDALHSERLGKYSFTFMLFHSLIRSQRFPFILEKKSELAENPIFNRQHTEGLSKTM